MISDQISVNSLTVTVLSYSGALSDERSKVFVNMYIYIYLTFSMFHMYSIYNIYTSPCQSRLGTADYALQDVATATTAL
jgi:hypothetical protein